MHKREMVSIIIPCYNESETLHYFYIEITEVIKCLADYDFELIFIDDGSNDNTLEIIRMFSKSNPIVKYFSLSRNFGKESAIKVGLDKSSGDLICMMDCDLQDPPYLIKEMLDHILLGYDCVAARRVNRDGEPFIKSFFSQMFYRLINIISETKIVDGSRDFRMMTRQMVNSILEITEYHRFSKGIFSWVGYRTKWLEFANANRVAGETKWSFVKLFIYAIEGIVSFSTVPLRISSFMGFVTFFFAIFSIIFLLLRKVMYPTVAINGWTSTLVITLLISGIQLISLGIASEYIARTYLESKRRPLYFIKETNTDENARYPKI